MSDKGDKWSFGGMSIEAWGCIFIGIFGIGALVIYAMRGGFESESRPSYFSSKKRNDSSRVRNGVGDDVRLFDQGIEIRGAEELMFCDPHFEIGKCAYDQESCGRGCEAFTTFACIDYRDKTDGDTHRDCYPKYEGCRVREMSVDGKCIVYRPGAPLIKKSR